MAPLAPQASHFGLILPLCTSSATVGLALYQYPQFTAFLGEDKLAGKTLSRYWTPIFKQGYIVISALGIGSTISGLLSARFLRTHATLETTDVAKWYTYGAILAAAHFAFVPLVGAPIRRMIERGNETSPLSEETVDRENREEMKTWFMWHTIRTLGIDLPALWCFAEGAALSFWVANA
ncbi:hypothetical protein BDY17DRAFT_327844 [Neohortaea acidophila]|uniref:DUF1772-domain-containing protein n=1 Tax=Neohortaea acidophila TaxID=245834 RepID=A0A6A6PHG8_9PEZI|nr:uncharacterized protein BDY17DRAFT_327844 [Neohortaea acidophila]KAF2479043.1 hypothetical protein BDY17DRAFT_327844 [Neohortaea acidophila]